MPPIQRLALALCAVAGLAATPARAQPVVPSFYPMGLLPDGTSSFVNGLSGDGGIAVGQSQGPTGIRGFRWARQGGVVELLGVANSSGICQPRGLSADGLTVVGTSAPYNRAVPVQWVGPATSPALLPRLPGDTAADAIAANADGSMIAGDSIGPTVGGYRAVRWVNGVPQNLGTLPGGSTATALGISGDGAVVVGDSKDATNFDHAFRWTTATGMVNLGTFPGGRTSYSTATNGDGSVVIGVSNDAAFNDHAFRWTAATGMVSLALPPGTSTSYVDAITPDGSIIVGSVPNPLGGSIGYLWNATGPHDINALLRDAGVDLTGWTLEGITAVSADGQTFAGVGYHVVGTTGHLEGWVGSVPGPGAIGPFAGLILLRRRVRQRS